MIEHTTVNPHLLEGWSGCHKAIYHVQENLLLERSFSFNVVSEWEWMRQEDVAMKRERADLLTLESAALHCQRDRTTERGGNGGGVFAIDDDCVLSSAIENEASEDI